MKADDFLNSTTKSADAFLGEAPKSNGLLDRLMSFIAVDPDTFAETQGVMPEASKAVLEAAATLGTGATSWIPAGLSMASFDMRSPAERAKTATEIQEALTYTPKSKAAQKLVEPVGQFFENYDIAGREYARNIENPLLATLVHTGTEAIPFLAPLAMKGVGAVKSGARDLAQLEGILERETATAPRVPLSSPAKPKAERFLDAAEDIPAPVQEAPKPTPSQEIQPVETIKVYRATNKPFEASFEPNEPLFVSPDEFVAKGYRFPGRTIETLELPSDAKILTYENTPKELYKMDEGHAIPRDGGDGLEIARYAKAKGYDAVEIGNKREIPTYAVVNKSVLKPAPVETIKVEPDVSNPPPASEIVQPGATSGVVAGKTEPGPTSGIQPASIAKSIEAKAIEAGMVKDGFEQLAGFDPTTMKAQAERAADLLTTDFEKARRVVRGEDPVPDGLRGVSIVKAMEERIKATKDADLAYELANSPLASEVSLAGQELSLTRGRELDSFSAKVAEVKKAREAQAGADVSKKAEVKKQLKEETQKVNLPKEELSWDRFLQSIAC